jgi:hypothetical protein
MLGKKNLENRHQHSHQYEEDTNIGEAITPNYVSLDMYRSPVS